jgi:Tol biopolymer transport system component
VKTLDGKSPAVDILAGTKLAATPGFAGRTGEGSREDIDAAWSPDGSSIVFAVTTGRNTASRRSEGMRRYRREPNSFSRLTPFCTALYSK